ncbi:MAG: SRPBCC family protein [Chloroflexota bacterium]
MIRGAIRIVAAVAGASVVADRLLAAARASSPPVSSLAVIDAPAERVWQELVDVEGQPRWMHDLKSVAIETPAPIGVGTRAVGTIRMFGLGTADPVVITAFDAPRRFAIEHDGLFTGSGEFRLEPGVDGTTTIVRWDERLVAPILPALAAVVLEPVFRAIFQADLHRLRRLVESGDPEREVAAAQAA